MLGAEGIQHVVQTQVPSNTVQIRLGCPGKAHLLDQDGCLGGSAYAQPAIHQREALGILYLQGAPEQQQHQWGHNAALPQKGAGRLHLQDTGAAVGLLLPLMTQLGAE